MITTSFGFDWIRATIVQVDRLHVARHNLQKALPIVEWRETKSAAFSYTEGLECEYGGIYWNEQHKEFGVMFNASGSQLSKLRQHGYNAMEVLSILNEQGWTIKRLDIAMDISNSGHRPKELYDAWRLGELTCKPRKVTIVQSRSSKQVSGETVYFGSRSSQVLLRVYDKAAEQGEKGDRIRIEFELKHDRANATALSVMDQGIPATMAALLTEQITAGIPRWIVEATDLHFEVVKMAATKETNFERWFYSTVIPAISKAIKLGTPDAEKLIANAIKEGKAGNDRNLRSDLHSSDGASFGADDDQ